MIQIDKKISIDRILVYVLLGIVAITLCIKFVMLNKGLIISDEGWYLCLLRDLPDIGSTRFQFLFQNIFQNNIYAIRLFVYFLTIISTFTFAFCFWKYCKNIYSSLSLWLCIGFAFIDQCYMADPDVISYVPLNRIVTQFSLAFLFLGLLNNKYIYYIASGFFIGFLFFIMPTNVIVIGLVLLVILLFSEKKVFSILAYCVGILITFLFYFIFIESFSSVIGSYENEFLNTIQRGTSAYGIVFLIKWLYKSGIYWLKLLLVATIIVMIPKAINKAESLKKYHVIIECFMVIAVVCYADIYIYPSFSNWSKDLAFQAYMWELSLILCCFLMIKSKIWNERRQFVLSLFLLLIPVCLSFGSDNPLYMRQISYFSFVLPLIALNLKSSKSKFVVLGGSLIYFAMLISSLFGPNWHGDKYMEQSLPVSKIGIKQNIKLDKSYINLLTFCQDHLQKGDMVVCDMESWGIAALLDLQPIDYHFRISDKIMSDLESGMLYKYEGVHFILKDDDESKEIFELLTKQNDSISILQFSNQGRTIFEVQKKHDSVMKIN